MENLELDQDALNDFVAETRLMNKKERSAFVRWSVKPSRKRMFRKFFEKVGSKAFNKVVNGVKLPSPALRAVQEEHLKDKILPHLSKTDGYLFSKFTWINNGFLKWLFKQYFKNKVKLYSENVEHNVLPIGLSAFKYAVIGGKTIRLDVPDSELLLLIKPLHTFRDWLSDKALKIYSNKANNIIYERYVEFGRMKAHLAMFMQIRVSYYAGDKEDEIEKTNEGTRALAEKFNKAVDLGLIDYATWGDAFGLQVTTLGLSETKFLCVYPIQKESKSVKEMNIIMGENVFVNEGQVQ